MEGAIPAASRLYGFIPYEIGQLRGNDQEYPKHMVVWQGLFFDPIRDPLKPWGLKCFKTMGGKIIEPQPFAIFI